MRLLSKLTASLLALTIVGCGGNSSGSKTPSRASAAPAVTAPTKEQKRELLR